MELIEARGSADTPGSPGPESDRIHPPIQRGLDICPCTPTFLCTKRAGTDLPALSRSEYFRQAATNLLGLTGEQEIDRYVRGYAKHPETPEEVEAARAASARSLAGEPWE